VPQNQSSGKKGKREERIEQFGVPVKIITFIAFPHKSHNLVKKLIKFYPLAADFAKFKNE
tara:strand:+ start:359 stop:538 length:180 start_codon:yes stop_codon:yes gene_type:complete